MCEGAAGRRALRDEASGRSPPAPRLHQQSLWLALPAVSSKVGSQRAEVSTLAAPAIAQQQIVCDQTLSREITASDDGAAAALARRIRPDGSRVEIFFLA